MKILFKNITRNKGCYKMKVLETEKANAVKKRRPFRVIVEKIIDE